MQQGPSSHRHRQPHAQHNAAAPAYVSYQHSGNNYINNNGVPTAMMAPPPSYGGGPQQLPCYGAPDHHHYHHQVNHSLPQQQQHYPQQQQQMPPPVYAAGGGVGITNMGFAAQMNHHHPMQSMEQPTTSRRTVPLPQQNNRQINGNACVSVRPMTVVQSKVSVGCGQKVPQPLPTYPGVSSSVPHVNVAVGPSVSVGGGVVPSSCAGGASPTFVVPALTPALTASLAVIKPSHQVLIVKPIPAFLTEDEDLLALAKGFVVSEALADQEASEVSRILTDGDEVVLDRIAQIRGEGVAKEKAASKTTERRETRNTGAAHHHVNYLPYAAKVIRKSVLSAITAAFHARMSAEQKKDQQSVAAVLLDAIATTAADASSSSSSPSTVMPANKCFCEEGYGFLLFATEEAGLTYMRAVQRLSSSAAADGVVNRADEKTSTFFGTRPENVAGVREDFNEISEIKQRVYEDAHDDDDNEDTDVLGLNASFSSSISSSSCDSATSFDSNSSFESVQSELPVVDEGVTASSQAPPAQQQPTRRDCDHCSRHRRMYRIYYRAKLNREINDVRIRCPVIVAENTKALAMLASQTTACRNGNRRPATFNGVPNASREHVAEMRSLFTNCFYNTVISVAGGDGTVAAKTKPKAVPLFPLAGTTTDANVDAQISRTLSNVPTETKAVTVHRPVLIDCTRKASSDDAPTIRFMGRSDNHSVSSTVAVSVVSEDLSRIAAELVKRHAVVPAPNEKRTLMVSPRPAVPFGRNHHTHHRHCVAHRAAAVSKRADLRRQKATLARSQSRARQAPLVVNVLNVNSNNVGCSSVAMVQPQQTYNTAEMARTLSVTSVSSPAVVPPPSYAAASSSPRPQKAAVPKANEVNNNVHHNGASAPVLSLFSVSPATMPSYSHSGMARSVSYDDEGGPTASAAASYSTMPHSAPTPTDDFNSRNVFNHDAAGSAREQQQQELETNSYASCSETPITACSSPVDVRSNGNQQQGKQQRFRYNPYSAVSSTTAVTTIAANPPSTSSQTVSETPVQINEKVVEHRTATVTSTAMPTSAGHVAPVAAHNNGPTGLAALLPAWANPAQMTNTSARLRNMLSMSKAKRF